MSCHVSRTTNGHLVVGTNYLCDSDATIRTLNKRPLQPFLRRRALSFDRFDGAPVSRMNNNVDDALSVDPFIYERRYSRDSIPTARRAVSAP